MGDETRSARQAPRQPKGKKAVSPEVKSKLTEWATPGNILQVAGIVVLVASTWAVNNYRLGDVTKNLEEIKAQQGQLQRDIAAIRSDQIEVIRQQERLAALANRVDSQGIDIKTLAAQADMLAMKIARLER